MSPPSISILIPTRERADTLRHTLRSCTDQSYQNLEIVVCDNFSLDNTRNVVGEVDDPRLRYVNTGRRLSMAANWEFALSQIDSDYVTIIGDDDGLIPGAISDLAALLQSSKSPVVTWKKAEYCWPNYLDEEIRNYLAIPVANRLISVPSKLALQHMYRFWMGYSKGPCVYNSVVSMQSLKKISDRDGLCFGAYCPDVYSSLALASVTDSYLFCTRPFSVNGASAHSNGTSAMRPDVDQAAARQFMSEYGDQELGFADVRGSITSAVMDSLVSFSDRCPTLAPQPPYRKAFRRIVAELSAWPGLLEENEERLTILAERHGHGPKVQRLLAREKSASANARVSARDAARPSPPVLEGENLVLWGDRHGVADVSQACNLAGRVLGSFAAPARVNRYSVASVIYSRCVRAAQNASPYIGA